MAQRAVTAQHMQTAPAPAIARAQRLVEQAVKTLEEADGPELLRDAEEMMTAYHILRTLVPRLIALKSSVSKSQIQPLPSSRYRKAPSRW